jgi:hypothetical protein
MTLPELGPRESLSGRIEMATMYLKELEPMLKSGEVDVRVLREFRKAVDFIRTSAWAVQQWIELKESRQDPYKVLALLVSERIERARQITTDLCHDLDAAEVNIEDKGVVDLYHAVEGLHERLVDLFSRKDDVEPPLPPETAL